MNNPARRCCLAIDAGYANFAFCFLANDALAAPVLWERQRLWHGRGRPNETEMIKLTKRWCEGHAELLQRADCIVLEKQMRTEFQVMNAVIHAFYFDKCQQVDARTVGAFWRLPHRRDPKKAAGVETALLNGLVFPENCGKRDDLADAWMMATWGLTNCGWLDAQQLLTKQWRPSKKSKHDE